MPFDKKLIDLGFIWHVIAFCHHWFMYCWL